MIEVNENQHDKKANVNKVNDTSFD